MVALLRIAGVVHLIILGANFAISGILDFKRELAKVSPIMRQIFVVHHAYIMFILALFAALCLGFPEDLAGASPLGTFLCGFMALFWLARLPVQFFFYDDEVKRLHKLGHWAFSFAVVSIAAVLSVAAARGLR
jgi:hypothetical protein